MSNSNNNPYIKTYRKMNLKMVIRMHDLKWGSQCEATILGNVEQAARLALEVEALSLVWQEKRAKADAARAKREAEAREEWFRRNGA